MSNKNQNRGASNYNFPKVSSEELNEIVKDYDFKKPKKFTKENLRGLNTVNESIIRIFSSNISGLLRTFCEVEMMKMEECRYMEYLNTLPEKTFIGLINMKITDSVADDYAVMVHFPSTVCFFLIDTLLGGDGHGYGYTRGYTDIEIAIIRNFFDKISNYFAESWKHLVDMKCELAAHETNPKLAQFVSLDDSVIVLSFRIKIGDIDDKFSFCIPSMNLDGVLRESSIQNAKSRRHEDEKEIVRREALSESLHESTLELTAVLDTIMLDVHDVVNLAVADIIPLCKKYDDNIIITVEGEPKFSAKLGDRRIKKSVRICGIATPAEINEFNNI